MLSSQLWDLFNFACRSICNNRAWEKVIKITVGPSPTVAWPRVTILQ